MVDLRYVLRLVLDGVVLDDLPLSRHILDFGDRLVLDNGLLIRDVFYSFLAWDGLARLTANLMHLRPDYVVREGVSAYV